MKLIQVLINSNVFYWYSRVFGDGFLLGVDMIRNFPVPESYDDRFMTLSQHLADALGDCTTVQVYRSVQVLSYNYNKRMDILLEIDDWIIKHVAPELNLPRDIFAQYKSNSFLRPLDRSALSEASEPESEDV